MFKRTALAALAFAGLAGGAFAQTSPTPTPQASMPSALIPYSPRAAEMSYMALGTPTRFTYQAQTDRARVKATPEEWRRAKQAALLINSNQCDKAYTLAVVEQDDRLAGSVKQVCAAEPRS